MNDSIFKEILVIILLIAAFIIGAFYGFFIGEDYTKFVEQKNICHQTNTTIAGYDKCKELKYDEFISSLGKKESEK